MRLNPVVRLEIELSQAITHETIHPCSFVNKLTDRSSRTNDPRRDRKH